MGNKQFTYNLYQQKNIPIGLKKRLDTKKKMSPMGWRGT